ncbi:hypothetical protein QBC39DRAFT_346148 [Podospora conica]|nr:hypothetical protein QBC39DRAFT_346148 [Schizothecium conicum]
MDAFKRFLRSVASVLLGCAGPEVEMEAPSAPSQNSAAAVRRSRMQTTVTPPSRHLTEALPLPAGFQTPITEHAPAQTIPSSRHQTDTSPRAPGFQTLIAQTSRTPTTPPSRDITETPPSPPSDFQTPSATSAGTPESPYASSSCYSRTGSTVSSRYSGEFYNQDMLSRGVRSSSWVRLADLLAPFPGSAVHPPETHENIAGFHRDATTASKRGQSMSSLDPQQRAEGSRVRRAPTV